MKTLEWQNFFTEQRALHGKVVFSVAELANAAQTTLHAVNTELGRLVRRGIIHRYAHGRYGPSQGVGPEAILSAVDPGAYITGFYALFRYHLVTQVPSEVTCFTHRRHNRKSDRITPAGKLRFICVPASV
jgi:predicted transcriptional regulator of viral defense system